MKEIEERRNGFRPNLKLLIGDYNKATLKNEMVTYDTRINISFYQMITRMKSLII